MTTEKIITGVVSDLFESDHGLLYGLAIDRLGREEEQAIFHEINEDSEKQELRRSELYGALMNSCQKQQKELLREYQRLHEESIDTRTRAYFQIGVTLGRLFERTFGTVVDECGCLETDTDAAKASRS